MKKKTSFENLRVMQSIFTLETGFLEGKILRDTTITEKPQHFIQFNNVFESHTTRQNIFVFMERNIHDCKKKKSDCGTGSRLCRQYVFIITISY